jgi:hypothetical protein
MEEIKMNCFNDIPSLVAEHVGCVSIERSIPRIFMGDEGEIKAYCEKNNLHPIKYLVREMNGSTNDNIIQVKITPYNFERVVAHDIWFRTDQNIDFNTELWVATDTINYKF